MKSWHYSRIFVGLLTFFVFVFGSLQWREVGSLTFLALLGSLIWLGYTWKEARLWRESQAEQQLLHELDKKKREA